MNLLLLYYLRELLYIRCNVTYQQALVWRQVSCANARKKLNILAATSKIHRNLQLVLVVDVHCG